MINVLLAVPTLSRYDRLEKMLQTVLGGTRLPNQVLIVDNGSRFHTQPYYDQMVRYLDLSVYQPSKNLGVAGSVNFAWRNTPQSWFFLHANDDLEYDPDCIRLMVQAAEASLDEKVSDFIIPEHGVGSAFTTFMAHRSLPDQIGYFDEQFFPAYFEDNDLGLRMNQFGVVRRIVKGAAYVHHTSSTKESYLPLQLDQHHKDFRLNSIRYEDKWGGPPEKETFYLPYAGKRGHNESNRHLWHLPEIP